MLEIKISEIDVIKLDRALMTQLLFEGISDDGKTGDCIFVFGSSKSLVYRFPKAIELYRAGRANKILFSGGIVWPGQGKTEAELMRDKAIELGIPEEDIIIETESRHTKENVIASMFALDRSLMLQNIQRILVVTTSYHMRRAHLTLKTYMPKWIDYSLCPVEDGTTRKDNWWLNESGTKRVEAESRKLVEYIRLGAIEDFKLL